ncbi:hypothetical protein EV360DRAFT_79950 [Lentinula raphanica]|nr:hypothetical protein EV360DRAFT_79950 [Lentinula raphanica]
MSPSDISTIPFPIIRSSRDPVFPPEVIELIIHETWKLPLTTSERARFMKTSLLVNVHWLSAFARESCMDVHLISSSYAMWYDGITFKKSFAYPVLAGIDGFAARDLARSFTVHCVKPKLNALSQLERHPAFTYPMGLSSYIVSIRLQQSFFPNFNGQVAVQFANDAMGLMDLCNVHFPPALRSIKRSALPVRDSTRSSWTLQLSGLRPIHAMPLYHLLTKFAEMANQDTSNAIPLIYEYSCEQIHQAYC